MKKFIKWFVALILFCLCFLFSLGAIQVYKEIGFPGIIQTTLALASGFFGFYLVWPKRKKKKEKEIPDVPVP